MDPIEFLIEQSRTTRVLDLSSMDISDFSRYLELLPKCKVQDCKGQECECLTHLNLSGNKLANIPSLKKLSNLEELLISDNLLTDLSFVEHNKELYHLEAAGNAIEKIEYLENLVDLNYLDLSRNKINSIEGLAESTRIFTLNLSYNQIGRISGLENLSIISELNLQHNQIAEIEGLTNCKLLHSINLSENQIETISGLNEQQDLAFLNISKNQIVKIEGLENLELLKELNLEQNAIKEIDGLSTLNELENLNLAGNKLNSAKGFSLLENLELLNLDKNSISSFSGLKKCSTLSYLRLTNNKIKVISKDDLLGMKELTFLFLSGNPIRSVNDSILGRYMTNCLGGLIDELAKVEKGQIRINNEIKIIVVGNGGVGKTQITNRFSFKDQKDFYFNPKHVETHGIIVKNRTLDVNNPLLPVDRLQIKLWDFAGQRIYNSTHRLFLRTKAIFLLVWDCKTELKLQKERGKSAPNLGYEQWLYYIKLFSNNSPVILLRNKYDQCKACEIQKVETNGERFETDFNVLNYIEVSAKEGTGFDALIETPISNFADNENLKQEFLKPINIKWDLLLNKIGSISSEKKVVSFDIFEEWCEELGVSGQIEKILDYLNNIGEIHYLKGGLKKYIVLDVGWAIQMVYRVFDENLKEKNRLFDPNRNGRIRYEELRGLWPDEEDFSLILDLLTSCELCFAREDEFGDKFYFFPQYFKDSPNDLSFLNHDIKLKTTLDINFEFLPDILIQKFILKVSEFEFVKLENFYKNGFVVSYLESDGKKSFLSIFSNRSTGILNIKYTENCNKLLLKIKYELYLLLGRIDMLQFLEDKYILKETSDPLTNMEHTGNNKKILILAKEFETFIQAQYRLLLGLQNDAIIIKSTIQQKKILDQKKKCLENLKIRKNEVYKKISSEIPEMSLAQIDNIYLQSATIQKNEIDNLKLRFPSIKKIILFISVKIKDLNTTRNPDKENRHIREGLQTTIERDKFRFEARQGVTPRSFRRSFTSLLPKFIHISSPYSNEEGLIIENLDGSELLFPAEGLNGLVRFYKESISCIFLNSANSDILAELISKNGIHVIGMNGEIDHKPSIIFSVAFYESLGEGKGVEESFDLARTDLSSFPEYYNTPELWYNGKKTNTTWKNSKQQNINQNSYALLIGIRYQNQASWHIKGTSNEMHDLRKLLTENIAAYPKENVIFLEEESATSVNILDAFDNLAKLVGVDEDATVLIYYSGHSFQKGKMGFLAPYDFDCERWKNFHAYDETKIVASANFAQKLKSIKSKKSIVIVDCYYSEILTPTLEFSTSQHPILEIFKKDLEELHEIPIQKGEGAQIVKGSGRYFISSCQAYERSKVLDSEGLLTKILLECLNGKGNIKKDGWVRFSDIKKYIPERMKVRNDELNKDQSTKRFRHTSLIKVLDNYSGEFIVCAYGLEKINGGGVTTVGVTESKMGEYIPGIKAEKAALNKNDKPLSPIIIVAVGVVISFMGELMPDSFKETVSAFLTVNTGISFTMFWGLCVVVLVFLLLFFTWKEQGIPNERRANNASQNQKSR